jgi:DNA modification methylase
MDALLLQASASAIPLKDETVQCVVTSPPYWGLRAYSGEQTVAWADGTCHPLGLEPTPELYVEHMVEVFREVRRVLRRDGTLWLNLGDSYFGTGKGPTHPTGFHGGGNGSAYPTAGVYSHDTLKQKDLVGIPWMVTFALRRDGWYLRSDIIWHKPNPMPESVTDRPTKAHEYIFLLAKSERYFYDHAAIREAQTYGGRDNGVGFGHGYDPEFKGRKKNGNKERKYRADMGGRDDYRGHQGCSFPWTDQDGKRNKRSVWTVPTAPYKGAHFATFPPELIEPCILAGSRPDDVVLDPFAGTGTTGEVALLNGRRFQGIELNPEYFEQHLCRRIERAAAEGYQQPLIAS